MATSSRVAAPARAHVDYAVELVSSPADLSADRAENVNIQLADTAFRACGGVATDDPDVEKIREGWRAYCLGPGGRCQDHDRVVLVWDGDKLVGFGGYVVRRMEPDATVLWFKAAGIDPDYQGRGAFRAVVEAISDLDWMTSFGSPTYQVMRTPNPLVYEVDRAFWLQRPEWYERFYPKVTPEGDIEPLDEEARDTGARIAKALWPECELDADRLILRDFLGEYGRDIWRAPAPVGLPAGTKRFFEENLRPNNQDALMAYCHFVR